MNKEVELFLKEFNEVIRECGKFCFTSRGKEFQQEAVKKLTRLKQKAISLKERMIKVKDENSANPMLSLENLIDAMINELEMWIALKEDDPNKAWDFLINAQSTVRRAAQAHSVAIDLNAEGYASKLHLLEKLLFPLKYFLALVLLLKRQSVQYVGRNMENVNILWGRPIWAKCAIK